MRHTPDINNLLKVLRREKTDEPVLFELFLNEVLHERFTGRKLGDYTPLNYLKFRVDAYAAAGYDYATTEACNMIFCPGAEHRKETISLNEAAYIQNREDFDNHPWPNPDLCDYSVLTEIEPYLPGNMKLMVLGPCGVLENVIALTGYDNLCYMLFDDPELVQDIFDRVGSLLLRYYEIALEYPSVGIVMSNDDWGFNSQTFLSVEDMRRFVFPWHKKIVAAAHRAGRPAILHSCGNMSQVFEDIITDMKFDGKHSYEDKIMPVEECYRIWGDRIAIIGGIDVDYLVRASEEEIRERSINLLKLTAKGGYALGSGNSIPEYIPYEKYISMTESRYLV